MVGKVVIGIGIDLVEIARVERMLARFEDRFLRRILGPSELTALPEDATGRLLALALAVAGKEAASKALGTGWSRGVVWRDVLVSTTPAPSLQLVGRAAEVARRLGSSGRARVRLEHRGELALGEVWLLS